MRMLNNDRRKSMRHTVSCLTLHSTGTHCWRTPSICLASTESVMTLRSGLRIRNRCYKLMTRQILWRLRSASLRKFLQISQAAANVSRHWMQLWRSLCSRGIASWIRCRQDRNISTNYGIISAGSRDRKSTSLRAHPVLSCSIEHVMRHGTGSWRR